MDDRNVRVLRCYEDCEAGDVIYIDDAARHALGNLEWGTKVLMHGRKRAEAEIKELREIDKDAQIARMNASLLEKLMIEWGEEVLIEQL